MHRCTNTSKFNSVRKTQMHQQGGNLKIKPRFCLVKIIHLEKLAKFPVTQNEARQTKVEMDAPSHSSLEDHPIIHEFLFAVMHCTDRHKRLMMASMCITSCLWHYQ